VPLIADVSLVFQLVNVRTKQYRVEYKRSAPTGPKLKVARNYDVKVIIIHLVKIYMTINVHGKMSSHDLVGMFLSEAEYPVFSRRR
jgi:hypothetical protein